MVDEVNLSPESIEALARALRGTGPTGRPSAGAGGGSGSGDTSFGAGTRRAIEDTGSALGNLTGFIGRAGGSIGDFTRQVGATTAITEIFGNVVGDGIAFLEDSNRVFQNLSKVGAGFNGDLGALRAAAANTRMPLDSFADLVGRNAQALAGLGAGVNNGTRRFAELSRAMFEDGQVIRGMTNLGYTLEEANEFLLDNANLLRRQQMLDGMNDQQVAQATLRMAENIAFMAEITGESAEQQRQELIDAQRDGRNIAALRALEAQGLEGVQESFNEAFTGLQAAGPAAQAFLQDMIQSGAPMSELTQNFAAMNPQVAAQIRQMAATIRSQEDAETKRQRVADQANRAVEISASEYVSATNLAVGALGQVSSVGQSQADLIAETENFRVGVEQMRRRMAMERGFESGYGDVSMQEAADRFMQETRDRVAAQTAGGAEGQAISRELNIATIDLANSAATVNQEIGRNLSANTELQNTIAAGLEGLTSLSRLLASGATQATRLLPGEVEEDRLQENNFRSLFEPLIVNSALLTRVVNFDENSDMISELQRLAQAGDRTATRMLEGMGIPIEPRASGGPVNVGQTYLVGEEGPETFVPGANGVILPNMQDEMASMQQAMETFLPAMRREANSIQNSLIQEDMISIRRAIETIVPQIRNEVGSIQDSLMQNEMASMQRIAESLTNNSRPEIPVDMALMQRTIESLANNLTSIQQPDIQTELSSMLQTMESLANNLRPDIQSEMVSVRRTMESFANNSRPEQSELSLIQRTMESFANNSTSIQQPDIAPEMSSVQRAVESLVNESSSMQQTAGTILPAMRSEAMSMQGSLTQMANNLRSRLEQISVNNSQPNTTEIIEQIRGAMSGNPNISTQRMEQLLDTLNQSMTQLVSINNNMSRHGQKTVEALRGASGNLLQGVRAR